MRRYFFLPHYRTLPVGPEDYRLVSLEGPIQSIPTSKYLVLVCTGAGRSASLVESIVASSAALLPLLV